MSLVKDSKDDSDDKRPSVKELSKNFEPSNAKQSNKNNQHILKPSQTLKKSLLKSRSSLEILNYFQKLEERISALESNKLESRLDSLESDVQFLKVESCSEREEKRVDEFNDETDLAIGEIDELNLILVVLDGRVSKLESNRQIDEIITKFEHYIIGVNEKVSKIENYEETLKNRLSKLESCVANVPIYKSGNYIWKVEKFKEKRLHAETGGPISITSNPFYTSEFGYKMCLKIYPAGDGANNDKYLSVYFVIVKGDYDNILPWPFKNKVILELLDQEGNEKHFTEVFRPDDKSECYKKPEKYMNVASGAPKFYELNKLFQNDKFYKDDSIYIKSSVK